MFMMIYLLYFWRSSFVCVDPSFCTVALLVISSICFACLKKSVIFPSIWETFSSVYILIWQLFLFNILKMLLHCLCSCIVSNKESGVILLFVPPSVMYFHLPWRPHFVFVVFFGFEFQWLEIDVFGFYFILFSLIQLGFLWASWLYLRLDIFHYL